MRFYVEGEHEDGQKFRFFVDTGEGKLLPGNGYTDLQARAAADDVYCELHDILGVD